ncbi:glycerophosphodiester phosphodiesterase [Acinetobacter sp. B5B]|uniref:glycerophosphodiester phosphodiesterase n=1 Tax=Acinetobacter baretiae TaxID=2605383 RepID=UPI0018C2507B|nr:glycerophosphodiester phosphodiesterase [Acinetobacter baretiae]MBF7682349.1 glycerophosphodiester phosphodiesterase [Acinetobacter baretiae]MBF7685177.1 glycerophosphodiester phosphodiesterase [Acinetobacter baretiae]
MQIIGHRGARNEAPENTLGGFNYLKQLGIDAVEFDLRQLHDHTLVVIHDDNLARTTGTSQPLTDCQARHLPQHNHCKLWPHWPHQEPTPTLTQVLEIIDHFTHIELEIKAVQSMSDAEKIIETLHQNLSSHFHKTLVITSFDVKILTALQKFTSPFKRGLLVEDTSHRAIDHALKLECCQIGWLNTLATQDQIKATHDAGLNVSVWTVNQPERARQLKDWGVNGLITDVPQLMQMHI